ncbi:hypothetical protein TGRUB_266380 [Toxoplasma gondii RUB]|uniref:Uncharacterized protein n=1 Tax=Toxoplasma gondii RUB TaxID=935652 RepID=A0A086LQA8_TOXGO|nr:hypothetical protein TGRUB_266380 [Toxoplasma gondii RUB]
MDVSASAARRLSGEGPEKDEEAANASEMFLDALIADTLDEMDRPFSFSSRLPSPFRTPASSFSSVASSDSSQPRPARSAEKSTREEATAERGALSAGSSRTDAEKHSEERKRGSAGEAKREKGERGRETTAQKRESEHEALKESILSLSSDLARSIEALVEEEFFAERPLSPLVLAPRQATRLPSPSRRAQTEDDALPSPLGGEGETRWPVLRGADSKHRGRLSAADKDIRREEMTKAKGTREENAPAAETPPLVSSSGVRTHEISPFSSEASTQAERRSTDGASLGSVEDQERDEKEKGFASRSSVTPEKVLGEASSDVPALSSAPSSLSSVFPPGRQTRSDGMSTHSLKSKDAILDCLDGLAAHANALALLGAEGEPAGGDEEGISKKRRNEKLSAAAFPLAPAGRKREECVTLSELSVALEAALKELASDEEEDEENQGEKAPDVAAAETPGWKRLLFPWSRDSVEAKALGEKTPGRPTRAEVLTKEAQPPHKEKEEDCSLLAFLEEAGEGVGEDADLLFVAVGDPFRRLLGALEPWLEREGRQLTETDRMRYMRQIQVYRQLVALCTPAEAARDGETAVGRERSRDRLATQAREKSQPQTPVDENQTTEVKAAAHRPFFCLTKNVAPPSFPVSLHGAESSSRSSSSFASSYSSLLSSSSSLHSCLPSLSSPSSALPAASSAPLSSPSAAASSRAVSSPIASLSHALPVVGKFARLQALLEELREYGEPPEAVLDALMPDAENAERSELCPGVPGERGDAASPPIGEKDEATSAGTGRRGHGDFNSPFLSKSSRREEQNATREADTRQPPGSPSTFYPVSSPEFSSSSSSSSTSSSASSSASLSSFSASSRPLFASSGEMTAGTAPRSTLQREEEERDAEVERRKKANGVQAGAKKKDRPEEKEERREEQAEPSDAEILRELLGFVGALETHAGGEGEKLQQLLQEPLKKLLEGDLSEEELLTFVASVDSDLPSEAGGKREREETKKEKRERRTKERSDEGERSKVEDGCRQQ